MFVPPHWLEAMAESSDRGHRELALHNLAAMHAVRSARAARATSRSTRTGDRAGTARRKHRVVRDAAEQPNFYGKVRRKEGERRTGDAAVDEAYRNTGIVLDFYHRVFGRDSVDGRGMPISSSVRFRQSPSPMLGAYWYHDQQALAYGEEIKGVIKRPTKALDLAGHEMTHGVVEFTAGFPEQDEPGALNESFADVMGCLVKQWRKDQTAKQANWLFGDEVVFKSRTVHAIRSLKHPGSAFTGVQGLGDDQQVSHLRDKYTGSDQANAVHINAGIPSHAFYRFAAALGGRAWERAGQVWYESLLRLHPDSDFEDCAKTTYIVAGIRHGQGSRVQKAVQSAWKAVGLSI